MWWQNPSCSSPQYQPYHPASYWCWSDEAVTAVDLSASQLSGCYSNHFDHRPVSCPPSRDHCLPSAEQQTGTVCPGGSRSTTSAHQDVVITCLDIFSYKTKLRYVNPLTITCIVHAVSKQKRAWFGHVLRRDISWRYQTKKKDQRVVCSGLVVSMLISGTRDA